jgi:DNA-nicking Smr family endonuclease
MGKDDETFQEAVRDVRPLPGRDPPQKPPKPAAIARFTRAEQAAVLREALALPEDPALLESADEMSFARPGTASDVLRRLRRGQYAVQAEIDLHGLSRQAAHAALREFVVDCTARELHCVRVIHGKGRRCGPRGPVIKHVVNHWLRRMQEVTAFVSARPVDGGTGAVYVLLARRVPRSKPR